VVVDGTAMLELEICNNEESLVGLSDNIVEFLEDRVDDESISLAVEVVNTTLVEAMNAMDVVEVGRLDDTWAVVALGETRLPASSVGSAFKSSAMPVQKLFKRVIAL